MHTDLPKTVNEALKILAYNDFFWPEAASAKINPHPKDRSTVTSLCESQYAWTEKQARLALVLLKRYLTKFQKHGMDIKDLLDDPKYDDDFRIINFEKAIDTWTDELGVKHIIMKFPYNKKIIQLIRTLKDKKNLPTGYAKYDGDGKKWTLKHTDVTAYYCTLIAARYDFEFLDKSILQDYDEVHKEIKNHKKPSARLLLGNIVIDHAPESLKEYWESNISKLPLLQQVDSLKNFGLKTRGISVNADNELAGKIAHNYNDKLWIDSKSYRKETVFQALLELDAFPLLMPVHSDVQEEAEVEEFWDWLNVFKRNGIDILNQCSWGFDLKEPIYRKDVDRHNDRTYVIHSHKSREYFENMFELHQMSKQFKFLDKNTKVLFVRNRIPRSLIKSNIKPKAALIALGGGYYSTGTDNLKRFLENLPKKLYYSDYQPSSYDWHDRVIVKL